MTVEQPVYASADGVRCTIDNVNSNVLPLQARELLRIPGAVIAGGYARRLLFETFPEVLPVGPIAADIDLFMLAGRTTPLGTLRALGYVEQSRSRSSVVYTRLGYGGPQLPLQIIESDTRMIPTALAPYDPTGGIEWRTPWDVIRGFGLTTEQFALYRPVVTEVGGEELLGEPTFMYGPYSVEDTAARRLRVNTIVDPVRLAYRMVKYGRKGYNVEPDVMMSLFDYWTKNPGERDQFRANNNRDDYDVHFGNPI